jgi:DNA polymerase
MLHNEHAEAELLEVIELARQFLEQEKELGLESIRMRPETLATLRSPARLSETAPASASGATPKTASTTGVPKADPEAALKKLSAVASGCTKCELSSTRTNVVFGQGNPRTKLVIIGEAPGADEDEQGLAFVGRAGKLLTKIIESVDLMREEVYICNILKCRPPGNRAPTTLEIECCIPYLMEQLEIIQPAIICALGNSAAQTLLETKSPMNRMRGRFHDYKGALFMPTYHPAALLRNPEYKRAVWEDIQMIRKEYDKS